MPSASPSTIGLLYSGGLDSAILLAHLLDQGRHVQPLYVRSHLHWEREELAAARRFLAAVAGPRLAPLQVLEQPLADVYSQHWSLTGQAVPAADTPDEAVYLPGRNALLLVKPFVWCVLHGVPELALAPLATNPFPDATDDFFARFEQALNQATATGDDTARGVTIVRPFAQLHKNQVMSLGRLYPLELTFSCLAPVAEAHCGRCNKCAERQAAFQSATFADPTLYASPAGAR